MAATLVYGSNVIADNLSDPAITQNVQSVSPMPASGFVAKYQDTFTDEEVIVLYNGVLSVENENWRKDHEYDHSYDSALKELEVILRSCATKYDEAVLGVTSKEVGVISSLLQKRVSDIYL